MKKAKRKKPRVKIHHFDCKECGRDSMSLDREERVCAACRVFGSQKPFQCPGCCSCRGGSL